VAVGRQVSSIGAQGGLPKFAGNPSDVWIAPHVRHSVSQRPKAVIEIQVAWLRPDPSGQEKIDHHVSRSHFDLCTNSGMKLSLQNSPLTIPPLMPPLSRRLTRTVASLSKPVLVSAKKAAEIALIKSSGCRGISA
jgi:hypothetical protein